MKLPVFFILRQTLLILFIIALLPGISQVQKGKIVAQEKCSADYVQSYAYYVPSYYQIDDSWPAIYVFDPAARGEVGASVFSQVAEEYGYLVFCSNNSKNGPVNEMVAAANAMYKDVHEKFSVNRNRQITTGFSGGSRFALYLAMNSTIFQAVIGCGAGYPAQGELSKSQEFLYVGLVGNTDFNYAEMMEFEELLNDYTIENQFSVFSGPHTWPPTHETEMAILWVELQQIKKGTIPSNENRINRYVELMDSLYQAYAKENNMINQHRVAENWVSGIHRLANAQLPAEYLKNLNESNTFKKALDHYNSLLEYEINTKNKYIEQFGFITYPVGNYSKDIDWWEKEVDTLYILANSENKTTSAVGERLISVLAVNSYYASTSMISSGRLEQARQFTDIWLLADPASLPANIMSARIYVEQNENSKAMQALKESVALGLSAKDLTQDTSFLKLRGKKKFDQLITELSPSISSQDK